MVNLALLNKPKKPRKPRGNQEFIYSKFHMPEDLDERRFYSCVIQSDKNSYVMFIELNFEETKIIAFDCCCKANEVNASMNKKLIFCKHLQHYADTLIRMGRYKPKIESEPKDL